jgi:DTW domain-containing protein YfiP
MSGLLDRPGDQSSPDEERVVQKLSRHQTKVLSDIQWRLRRSILRHAGYLARLDIVEVKRERALQDRMLDELLAEVPALRVTLPPEEPERG